jgi:hypothetical protein
MALTAAQRLGLAGETAEEKELNFEVVSAGEIQRDAFSLFETAEAACRRGGNPLIKIGAFPLHASSVSCLLPGGRMNSDVGSVIPPPVLHR